MRHPSSIEKLFRNQRPFHHDLEDVKVDALADSVAVHLFIPQHIQFQLELEEIDKKEVTLADGSQKLVPYLGPIEIRFKNPGGFAGGLVMNDQTLLGAILLEDMNLIITPRTKKVALKLGGPNIATPNGK